MNVQSESFLCDDTTTVVPELLLLAGESCAVYCFKGLGGELPAEGTAEGAQWRALSWMRDGVGHALAVLSVTTVGDIRIRDTHGGPGVRVERSGRVSTDASALAQFLLDTEAPVGPAAQFLEAALGTGPEAHAAGRFMVKVLCEVSQTDGFVELSVRPECGGLFLQGWSYTALRGPITLFGDATRLTALAVGFAREDILPPASGVCLFIKDWQGRISGNSTLFFEAGGRPLRLEVLPGAGQPVTDVAATDHVRAILPRLEGDAATRAQFDRICRPRYTGENTLAQYPGATTAAVDRVLHTPAGGLFVTGWVLDPLAQVEQVILKSSGNLYAPLQGQWHRTERPDLNDAFAADPRFAGLIDPRERLHGFVCAVKADPATLDGTQVYLEILLSDKSCLFLPCNLTPCAGHGAAHPVIAALAPHDPALVSLISQHAAPFLETVPVRRKRPTQVALQPVGGGLGGKCVSAVMPVSDIAHLQPVMSGLAGTPDADALELVLVVGRDGAAGLVEDLDHAFRFYGLSGALMLVPDHETLAARLDAGVAVTDAEKILIWQPSVLPKASGWLTDLRQALVHCGEGAIVSPLLVYEDGSIYFGGSSGEAVPDGGVCAFLGFERRRISSGDPRQANVLPSEIALLDRAALEAAGGFAGRLWGDRFIGQDLSLRLAAQGSRPWCVPNVEFWMLDAARTQDHDTARMIDRIDAALIARRKTSGMEI